ncbi:MAG: hypothetical protein ACUVX9_03770 [Anaerolineae bacterium]
MEERELQALHRAVEPVLQRTAPTPAQGAVPVTPATLDQIAWNLVLVYVAHSVPSSAAALPPETKTGQAPLAREQVRSVLTNLRREDVRSSWRGGAAPGFGSAARRLLTAHGWSAQRASQAAEELGRALAAAFTSGR